MKVILTIYKTSDSKNHQLLKLRWVSAGLDLQQTSKEITAASSLNVTQTHIGSLYNYECACFCESQK